MKVLLRDTQSGLFYADADHWTGQYSEVRDFETPDLALEQVSSANLAGVEVIVHFENPAFDLPLTIHNAVR